MEPLRVTMVQTSLHWEDREANLEQFSGLLRGLEGQTDLVVLPEMFTTGFSMAPQKWAERMDGPAMAWISGQARRLGAVVTGSLVMEENGAFYNRLIWMRPDGAFETYDKRHLFSLAGEHLHYQGGTRRLAAEWKGWRICPLICYDLRFPVWSRNEASSPYDLLIYVANFPARRRAAWKNLLVARAIENQAYVVGVNRIGSDGNGHEHSGDSSFIDYEGNLLFRLSHQQGVFTTPLDPLGLQEFRKKFPFLADQDKFSLE
ncbi:MAG: Omega-amidase YafV [Haliscomenobacter sp.]|nr:Omega-amidase YafV [Haliscomenobacter sp.]